MRSCSGIRHQACETAEMQLMIADEVIVIRGPDSGPLLFQDSLMTRIGLPRKGGTRLATLTILSSCS